MAINPNNLINSARDSAENTISSFQQLALEKKMEAQKKAAELKKKAEDAKEKAAEAKKKAAALKAMLKGFKVPSLPKVPKFKTRDIKVPTQYKKILKLKAISELKQLNGFKIPSKSEINSKLKKYQSDFAKGVKSPAALEAELSPLAGKIKNIAPTLTGPVIASAYDKLFKGVGKIVNLGGASEITYSPQYPPIGVDTTFTPTVFTGGGSGGSSGGSGTGGSGGGSGTGGTGGTGGSGGGGSDVPFVGSSDGGPIETGGSASGGYSIEVTAPNEFNVYGLYKSMVHGNFSGTPDYILEWPSNPIMNASAGKATVTVSVQLYDSAGRLLISSRGKSVDAGHGSWGNNHRAFFVIPAGVYNVKITNEGSGYTGKYDDAFILAQGWYQKPNIQYIDRTRIFPGQTASFNINTGDISPKSANNNNLIKINNTNILE